MSRRRSTRWFIACLFLALAASGQAAVPAGAATVAGTVEFTGPYYDDPCSGGNGQYYYYATNNCDGQVLCTVWNLGVKYSRSAAVGESVRIDVGQSHDDQTVTFEAAYE